jgi:UPF0271 protein
VACGAHAGDAATIERAVAEAARLGLAVGAHPGYPDREGFGRRALDLPPEELVRSIVAQVSVVAEACARHALRLAHVKPHGALYNRAAVDRELADLVARAVREAGPGLRLVGLAGSALVDAGRAAGLAVAAEAFADRAYRADGTLVPRGEPGALIEDPEEAAARAVAIARGEPLPAVGGVLALAADTICLHADTPGAARIARAVRRALEAAGVRVAPLPDAEERAEW